MVALGERAFFTRAYRWTDRDGKPGHVRDGVLYPVVTVELIDSRGAE